MKKKMIRTLTTLMLVVLVVACMAVPAFATSGDVSGALESTWEAAKTQVQDIVNNVVFPVIDMVLAILLFTKIATTYMDCAPVAAM